VSLSGTTATYLPVAGFTGIDAFTYAAWDGSIDSNLATVVVTVGPAPGCVLTSTVSAPSTAAVGASVPFSATVTAQGCSGPVSYVWNFGDGNTGTGSTTAHAYAAAGAYAWTMTASAGGQTTSEAGSITITAGCSLTSTATVPPTATVGVSVPFELTVTTDCSGPISYVWDFGDGTAHGTIRAPTHTYTTEGAFHWAVTASGNGQTTSQAGNITVSPASLPAPTVTSVRQQANPFRIRIDGTDFVNGLNVFIGSDTVAWLGVQFVSARRISLNGDGLATKFPLGQTISIRIVNPDGQSVSTSFRRR